MLPIYIDSQLAPETIAETVDDLVLQTTEGTNHWSYVTTNWVIGTDASLCNSIIIKEQTDQDFHPMPNGWSHLEMFGCEPAAKNTKEIK